MLHCSCPPPHALTCSSRLTPSRPHLQLALDPLEATDVLPCRVGHLDDRLSQGAGVAHAQGSLEVVLGDRHGGEHLQGGGRRRGEPSSDDEGEKGVKNREKGKKGKLSEKEGEGTKGVKMRERGKGSENEGEGKRE